MSLVEPQLEESRRPSLERSLARTTGELDSLVDQGYSPGVIASINRMNQLRVRRGQRPYTIGSEGARKGLLAAQTGEPQTEAKERGGGLFDLYGNTLHNLKEIGGAMSPTVLARGLAREFGGLSQIPQSIGESFAGGNILEGIGNLAGKPVFDLLPGSYVLEQTLGEEGGGFKALMQNPLITALDVAPFAGTAARATSAGRALGDARQAAYHAQVAEVQAKRAVQPNSIILSPRQPRRVGATSLLRERAVDGAIQPTAFGRGMSQAGAAFGDTRLGRFANRTLFPGRGGDVAQVTAQAEQAVRMHRTGIKGFDDLDDLGQRADAVEAAHVDLTPDEKAAVFDRIETGDPIDDLTETQQSYYTQSVEMLDEMEQIRLNNEFLEDGERLGRIEYDGRTVTASSRAVNRLNTHRRRAATANNLEALDQLIRSDHVRNLDADVVMGELAETLGSGVGAKGKPFTLAERAQVSKQYLTALRAAGYKVDDLFKRVNDRDFSWVTEARDWTRREFIPWEDVTAKFQSLQPRFPAVRFTAAMREGRWQNALTDARTLAKSFPDDPQVAAMVDQLAEQAQVAKDLARQPNYAKQARQARARLKGAEARFTPPAWDGVARRAKEDLAKGRVRAVEGLSEATVDDLFEKIENGMYRSIADDIDIRGLNAEARAMTREIMATRPDLNPRFIHSAGEDQLRSLQSPRIVADPDAVARTARERTFDWSPPAKQPVLQIKHEIQDIMAAKMSKALAEEIPDLVGGLKRADLEAKLLPEARAIQARQPHRNLQTIINELASKRYRPLNPGWFGGKRLTGAGAPDMWIPSYAADVLDDLAGAGPLGGLEKLLGPVSDVFRTSVLGLALRWHINNLVGNSMVSLFRSSNPLHMLRYLRMAREMLKKGEFGDIPIEQVGVGSGAGSMSAEMTVDAVSAQVRKATQQSAEATKMIYQYKAGRTMRRLYDDYMGKFVQKSFKFNQDIDSYFRVANYLDQYEASLKKGVPDNVAREMGVSHAQKVMQQWSRMTPMERSLLRTVMPFYGWISHVMKYVLTYPVDHPWRASILANFAKSEVEDYGTGLPFQFFEMFKIGVPGKDGMQLTIDPGGMNPFGDMQNYFRLQGFVGQLHPVFGAVLESLGVDTRDGVGELYPEMFYNSDTGRLEAKPTGISGIFGNVITSLVPQSEAILHLTGINEGFSELLETNPDAARRMMQSSLGLPATWRYIDEPKERFRSELARHDDQKTAVRKALESGDASKLQDYPTAKALMAQIQALSPEQLDQYRVEGARSPVARLFGLGS